MEEEYRFTTGQALVFTIVDVEDAQGQPAQLPEMPEWTTSDTDILELTATPDGIAASGIAKTSGLVTVTATSGDIVKAVIVEVGAGDAVTFRIEVTVAVATLPLPIPPPAASPAKAKK